MSLPFVFIVSGKQSAQAWTTIIWDNAFFEVNRKPSQFNEQIEWPKMSIELQQMFESQTGYRMTDDNLNYLRTYSMHFIWIKISFKGSIKLVSKIFI